MKEEEGYWYTAEDGRRVHVEEGETPYSAYKRMYGEPFDHEDEEINLETDDLDSDVELVTTRYVLEGMGNISPLAYEKLKAEGKNVYTVTERTPIDKLPYQKLTKREDIKTATKKVNPLYSTGDYAWTYNCQRCVVALEMRLRGYDVTAKPRLPENEDDIFKTGSKWSESFEGFEWQSVDYYYPGSNSMSAEIMERRMINMGENARFLMYIQWRKDRGGHTVMGIAARIIIVD